VIEKGYRDFTSRVAQARRRSVDQVDDVARGRVWTGAQAKERGLVDAFGGLKTAIDDAAARAKLGKEGKYRVRYLEKEATPFERFFANFVQSRIGASWLHDSSFAQGLARTMVERAVPGVHADLQFLDAALERKPGAPVKALAYCFCEL
jgi:protease-4